MARKCSKCGERLFPTDTFCGFCGEPVGEQVTGVDEKIYTPRPLVGEGSISPVERRQLERAKRVLASNPDVVKAEVERREKAAREAAEKETKEVKEAEKSTAAESAKQSAEETLKAEAEIEAESSASEDQSTEEALKAEAERETVEAEGSAAAESENQSIEEALRAEAERQAAEEVGNSTSAEDTKQSTEEALRAEAERQAAEETENNAGAEDTDQSTEEALTAEAEKETVTEADEAETAGNGAEETAIDSRTDVEAEAEENSGASDTTPELSESEDLLTIEEELRIARENAERAEAESREAEKAVALARAEAEEYRKSIGYEEEENEDGEGEIVDNPPDDEDEEELDRVIRSNDKAGSGKRIRDIVLLAAGIVVLLVLLAMLLKDNIKDKKGNDAYHNDKLATADVADQGSPTPTPTNTPTPTPTNTPTPTPIPYAPSDLETAWDGSVAEMLCEGHGTETEPFQIRCGSELAFIAGEVNRGVNFENVYFSLENDIDLSDMEWLPIGYYYNAGEEGDLVYSFGGILQGNGHKITNFHVETLEKTAELNSFSNNITVGLFGALSGAKIDGLGIENARITITRDEGEVLAGVLAGYIGASNISNCGINGSLEINGKSRVAAGIAGGAVSETEFADCISDGSVTVGDQTGVVDAGLFTGYAVSTKFARVSVNGSANAATNGNIYLGGVCGYSSESQFEEDTATVGLVANAKTTDSFIMVGGIAGANYSGSDLKCNATAGINANGSQDMYIGGAYGYAENAKLNEITVNTTMDLIDGGEFATLMAGGVGGFISGCELSGTEAKGSIKTNTLTKNYLGGMLGSGSNNTVSNFVSSVNLDATARGVTKSDVRAGGIAGNNVGSVFNNITITGNVTVNSGVNGYVGGAFGYIRDGEYNNISATGELVNKSKTGVSTGGIAGYASGNSVLNGCTGSAKRKNEGRNVYDNDIIGIKAE